MYKVRVGFGDHPLDAQVTFIWLPTSANERRGADPTTRFQRDVPFLQFSKQRHSVFIPSISRVLLDL
ncbi:hypothetical protein MHYP_G00251090 [Metynnis hypsauchen]